MLTATHRVAPIALATLLVTALVALTALDPSAHAVPPAKAAGTSHLTVGIGDENPTLFANAEFQALDTKIARYFTPYDIMAGKDAADRYSLEVWLADAQAAGIQPLVAFYHNESSPKKMPSVATYTKDVKLFLAAFPQVKLLEPWNEANFGNSGGFHSPSAKQSAQYYLALKKACPSCTVVGLDVLDSTTPAATIRYINQFKHDVGKNHIPQIWGLHNYSDTNRFYDRGTKAVLADVPGQVWLTETGGLAKLSPSFHFNLKRQAKATTYMFHLADSSGRITRLYIYQWYGVRHENRTAFDAGLANYAGTPRPAYCIVYEHLRGSKKCPYKTAKN
jgi:hypothetical protein